jgi:hypothetical protein
MSAPPSGRKGKLCFWPASVNPFFQFFLRPGLMASQAAPAVDFRAGPPSTGASGNGSEVHSRGGLGPLRAAQGRSHRGRRGPFAAPMRHPLKGLGTYHQDGGSTLPRQSTSIPQSSGFSPCPFLEAQSSYLRAPTADPTLYIPT